MKVKELIRAEIDKRYEENREKARYDDYYRGMNDGLDHFEQFLDTLPDEPVSDDLEKAADDYIGEVVDAAGHPGWDWETRDIIEAYIAGAKRHRGQKPIDDKAFEEWIDDWWKHNKVNNPDSYDKGDEIQFDEQGFKNFCRGIRNMYTEK